MTELSEDDKKSLEPILDYFDGDYEKFLYDKELEGGNFDFILLEKIVKLAKSQNVQHRIQSLDLIDTPSNRLPLGFEQNLLIALKKDLNEQVREKAKIID